VPSANELLAAWERGARRSPLGRALILLGAARPEWPESTHAALSIGRRDSELLTLRSAAFGDHLVGLTSCPNCSEEVELHIAVADLVVAADAEPDEEIQITMDGYVVQARTLASQDLVEVASSATATAARDTVLRRCVTSAYRDGTPVNSDDLPTAVLDNVEDALGRSDPQADIELEVRCPACDEVWHPVFDIVSFLWIELDAWARRTLHEVHRLARAYGWPESGILALSAPRRQAYLDLVES